MPPPEVADLIDFAVVLDSWSYNRHGRLTTTDQPREIACRWVEDLTSSPSPDSEVRGVLAQVYVAEDIGLGSILWHGRLADFPRDWENENPLELVEVDNFHKTPSLDGRTFRRWCDVIRYKDQLPEVA